MRIARALITSVIVIATLTGVMDGACAQIGSLPFAPIGRPFGPWGPYLGPRRAFGLPPRFRPRWFYGPPRVMGIAPGPGPGGARRFDGGPGGRVCFTPAETREMVAERGLADPLRALKPDRLDGGEALRARLCRLNADQFIYDIAVLRRDGRIVHVYMNAQTGKNIGPTN
jgi:hypothetical protein